MPSKTSDTRLTVRFSQAEYRLLKAKAGSRPLSTFVRELSLQKAEQRRMAPRSAPIKDHVSLAQVLAKLGQANIFAGLNELDEFSDLGLIEFDEDTKIAVKQACSDIGIIKKHIMIALGVKEV
jgi:hypothetical protein